MSELQQLVEDLVEELAVPGAAVGVLVDGQAHEAYAGVTSVENLLPVDAGTPPDLVGQAAPPAEGGAPAAQGTAPDQGGA